MKLHEMFGQGFGQFSPSNLTDEGLMQRYANNKEYEVPCLDCDAPMEIVGYIKSGQEMVRCDNCGEAQHIPRMLRQDLADQDAKTERDAPDLDQYGSNEMAGGVQ